MDKKTPKAIALMSGGLDSTLAAKVVKDQGVEVIGLHLLSPFGCREEVEKSAAIIDVKLVFKEKGEAYLDLVKSPKYGYGRNMNPCIDCRIFMFQLAEVVLEEQEADFIVTGEVLGQRPMSQHRSAMELIDRKSPLERLILRPLSARCFEPTIPEEKGWVDREKLFSISGRGRKDQMAMAASLGIREYKSPGGGCLLTESAFSSRLRDFFQNPTYATSEERMAQSELLRVGRHFRLSPQLKVLLGRDQGENEMMQKLWPTARGVLFNPENFDGPTAIALGTMDDAGIETVGAMIARYGKSKGLAEVKVAYHSQGNTGSFVVHRMLTEDELAAWRL